MTSSGHYESSEGDVGEPSNFKPYNSNGEGINDFMATADMNAERLARSQLSDDDHTAKRRPRRTFSEDARSSYLIVHRVVCEQYVVADEDHQAHSAEADYLDAPQLFPGDNRASALRGMERLDDLEEYWDENPEILFVVTREYNCMRYHAKIRDQFELVIPGFERQLPKKIRPWLYKLVSPVPPAEHMSESIELMDTFEDDMSEFVLKNGSILGNWDPKSSLQEPYDYFYHFRHLLRREAFSKLHRGENTRLCMLLDYIDLTKGQEFDRIDESFKSGEVRRETFSKLFRPKDTAIAVEDGFPRAFVVEEVSSYIVREQSERQSLQLDCWTWNFDGSFQKQPKSLTVSWPSSKNGPIPIESLNVRPLRFCEPSLAESLMKRGRFFWSCRKRRLVSYNPPVPDIRELQITNAKYMVDYQTYRRMHPSTSKIPSASDADMRENGIDVESDEPPDDSFCILLPPTIPGYAFHNKKWRSLSVEHVEKATWNKQAFDRLVLNWKKKETIKALVTVHLKTVQNVDIVENKGNGLIMLLHGSPGTGKTLTAESVAEFTEKPLYRVTCGDIGTNAESVEKYMESVLYLGSIWECVVLLDEADVFLEERQVTDLTRNALVSVFLRVLEYYNGILILTTNRVGTFDEAFKSRIQLAVHYPALDEEGRFEVWQNFIQVMKEKQVDVDIDELSRKVALLARNAFNGRQIRNILWAAAQVAKYKSEKLRFSHLEQVVEISQEFEQYLEETHGYTDADNARFLKVRGS